MRNMKKGIELHSGDRAHVLAAFVHRFTKDHTPNWAKNSKFSVQFASDEDWLNNTWFPVTKDGYLDRRCSLCDSHPTWPNNPELRTITIGRLVKIG